ncbi:hypothetical protein D3C80_2016480 [compost metagenome]
MIRRGHYANTPKRSNRLRDALVVGSNHDNLSMSNLQGPFVYVLYHGFARDIGQRLAGQTC